MPIKEDGNRRERLFTSLSIIRTRDSERTISNVCIQCGQVPLKIYFAILSPSGHYITMNSILWITCILLPDNLLIRLFVSVACVAIAMNAMLNNVDIEVSWKNLLISSPEQPYDLIFVGDLLYDEEIANNLITWLEKAHTRGAQIYLGDPGRHGLTENFKKRMRLLKRYVLPENVKKENHGYDTATVWEFQQI